MKLILSSHNVTLTEAIEAHILAKLDKLEHLDHRAISARIKRVMGSAAKVANHQVFQERQLSVKEMTASGNDRKRK